MSRKFAAVFYRWLVWRNCEWQAATLAAAVVTIVTVLARTAVVHT
jgi:hypothetical protein